MNLLGAGRSGEWDSWFVLNDPERNHKYHRKLGKDRYACLIEGIHWLMCTDSYHRILTCTGLNFPSLLQENERKVNVKLDSGFCTYLYVHCVFKEWMSTEFVHFATKLNVDRLVANYTRNLGYNKVCAKDVVKQKGSIVYTCNLLPCPTLPNMWRWDYVVNPIQHMTDPSSSSDVREENVPMVIWQRKYSMKMEMLLLRWE